MVSLLVCYWNFGNLKTHHVNVFSSDSEEGLIRQKDNQHSSQLSNVDKLVKLRTKDIDDEVLYKNYAMLGPNFNTLYFDVKLGP